MKGLKKTKKKQRFCNNLLKVLALGCQATSHISLFPFVSLYKARGKQLFCVFACGSGPVSTDLLDGGGELQTQLNDLVLGSCEVADPCQRCPAKRKVRQ